MAGRGAAEVLWWAGVGLVVYAYAGYPLVLALIARVRRRTIVRDDVDRPVTFIITAHNEAARLAAKIDNTLAQSYPADRLEIIVASDGSTDETDDIARRYAPRVRLVRTAERRGKEAAQQAAVECATGDVLVFSDVATALDRDAVRTITANFADPTVGCVSSIDRFIDDDGRVSGEGAYVRYEMRLRELETNANTLVGLSGSFFAARREACRPWKADRQSDFNTLLNSMAQGLRGVLDVHSVGYYRNISDPHREFERKVRTVVRGLYVLSSSAGMLNPLTHGLFAWQLASHKLCRWLVPFGLIVAALATAALATQSPWYFAAALVQIAFYGAAAIGITTGAPRLRVPAFFVLANAAVLVAWVRFARGERIVSWTPSTRSSGPIANAPHI